MRPPNRSGNDHVTLVLLELVAVPVALLVTFFALALAELVAAAVRAGIGAVTASGTALEAGNAVIALGTLLALVTGGGLLVVGYRRYFELSFEEVNPIPVLLVPIVGIAVPVGYAVWDTSSLQLSWWLFLPVAVFAYALAYRTIAIDSRREDSGRTSVVVGSLTALPVVVALVDLASGMLDPELPVARSLDAAVSGTGIPMERSVVIAVPLLVTALYGVERIYDTQSRWDGPDWSFSRPPLPTFDRPSFDLPSWDRTEPSGRQSTGAGAPRASAESARSSDGSVASAAPSASTNRSRTAGDVVPSSPGSKPARRGRSSSTDDDSRPPDESATDATSGDDRSASDSREESSADDAASTETGGAAAGSSTDGTGSDTQIFVDDFDQYVPEETPVETCPDCDEEIPSDGVYNFCPFCGGEL